MLRIAVAITVVTLTGLPVLPAICLSWCGTHTTTSEHRHDEAVESGSPAMTAGAMCGALVTDHPFIGEDARPVLHTVHQIPAARKNVMGLSAAAHTVRAPGHEVHPVAPAPPLVLRV
jgi:hypothetical protein